MRLIQLDLRYLDERQYWSEIKVALVLRSVDSRKRATGGTAPKKNQQYPRKRLLCQTCRQRTNVEFAELVL